jgi:hypothetical protein
MSDLLGTDLFSTVQSVKNETDDGWTCLSGIYRVLLVPFSLDVPALSITS